MFQFFLVCFSSSRENNKNEIKSLDQITSHISYIRRQLLFSSLCLPILPLHSMAPSQLSHAALPLIELEQAQYFRASSLEVERAQIFRARAELELWVSSPDEPELVKIPFGPASSPSILLIRIKKFKLNPTSSLSVI